MTVTKFQTSLVRRKSISKVAFGSKSPILTKFWENFSPKFLNFEFLHPNKIFFSKSGSVKTEKQVSRIFSEIFKLLLPAVLSEKVPQCMHLYPIFTRFHSDLVLCSTLGSLHASKVKLLQIQLHACRPCHLSTLLKKIFKPRNAVVGLETCTEEMHWNGSFISSENIRLMYVGW